MRWTTNKDVNAVVDEAIKAGWKVTRTKAGPLRLTPPDEVLKANKDLKGFVTVHESISDRRGPANLRSEIRQYRDGWNQVRRSRRVNSHPTITQTTKYFCRTCGPEGEEFLSLDDRDRHCNAVHLLTVDTSTDEAAVALPDYIMREQAPDKSRARSYQCPFCNWNKTGRVLRQHVRKHHPDEHTRIRADLLTLEGIEQAATMSWEPQADTEQTWAMTFEEIIEVYSGGQGVCPSRAERVNAIFELLERELSTPR